MKERFNFQDYRDDLAQKARGEVESSPAVPTEAGQTQGDHDYIIAKTLKRVAHGIDAEKIASTREKFRRPEAELGEEWNVREIPKDEMPQNIKFALDASLMGIATAEHPRYDFKLNSIRKINDHVNAALGGGPKAGLEGPIVFRHEIGDFVDKLSGGRLHDAHNLSHAIGVVASDSALEVANQAFDVGSKIQPSRGLEFGQDGFWFCARGNNYVNVESPVIIFSPKNPRLREMFEKGFYPDIEEMLKAIDERYPGEKFKELFVEMIKEGLGGRENAFGGGGQFTRLCFLAGYKIGAKPSENIFIPYESPTMRKERNLAGKRGPLDLEETWADVADCIVDLRAAKVYTREYSEEESAQTSSSEQKYRKWIEDRLGCSLASLVKDIAGRDAEFW